MQQHKITCKTNHSTCNLKFKTKNKAYYGDVSTIVIFSYALACQNMWEKNYNPSHFYKQDMPYLYETRKATPHARYKFWVTTQETSVIFFVDN